MGRAYNGDDDDDFGPVYYVIRKGERCPPVWALCKGAPWLYIGNCARETNWKGARVCRDENRGECFYALICLSRTRIRALKGLDALGCLWGRLAFN